MGNLNDPNDPSDPSDPGDQVKDQKNDVILSTPRKPDQNIFRQRFAPAGCTPACQVSFTAVRVQTIRRSFLKTTFDC